MTLTPGNTVDVNEACSDATCCRELSSVCDRDGEVTAHSYSADECPGRPGGMPISTRNTG